MRNYDTPVRAIRHKVYVEVAKAGFESTDETLIHDIEAIPYNIVEEKAKYRESIYRERAVASERVRLAMGLSLRPENKAVHLTDGLAASNINEKYYEPPLMQVIPSACAACPPNKYIVSNMCRGCVAHPCMQACPKGAISMKDGKSFIDQEKCIKCGKCKAACPYDAISHNVRPCEQACGVKAIGSDEQGRASILEDKCVSCGMCLVSCPFSAIVDKGQIFQTILTINSGAPVYAIVAPAVAGQFGPDMKPEKIRPAFQALGFKDVVEVAVGADLCTIEEAKDFMEEVPEKIPFMGTSCCPAWSVMAKKLFPEYADCISMALTPMVLTARLLKEKEPDCKIVFVGPCAAKKLEASRKSVRSYVDFVLTFEEVQGMFDAKNVNFKELPDGEPLKQASSDGRGFAVSGGVAAAVVKAVNRMDPTRTVKVVSAEGLANCKKMMQLAKAGKYNGYLLEGMACPGGCVAGAGTIQPIKKTVTSLELMKKQAEFEECMDTKSCL